MYNTILMIGTIQSKFPLVMIKTWNDQSVFKRNLMEIIMSIGLIRENLRECDSLNQLNHRANMQQKENKKVNAFSLQQPKTNQTFR